MAGWELEQHLTAMLNSYIYMYSFVGRCQVMNEIKLTAKHNPYTTDCAVPTKWQVVPPNLILKVLAYLAE